jgi:hypothetical protein
LAKALRNLQVDSHGGTVQLAHPLCAGLACGSSSEQPHHNATRDRAIPKWRPIPRG